MKKSLTRSISYWLLLVLSVASAAAGAWIISDQTATMTARLLDGTATGVEVYVGQPWIVVGAALLGSGVIGVLLTLALTAARSVVPSAAPVAEPVVGPAIAEDAADTTTSAGRDSENQDEDQNGSSGSTATATKISVR